MSLTSLDIVELMRCCVGSVRDHMWIDGSGKKDENNWSKYIHYIAKTIYSLIRIMEIRCSSHFHGHVFMCSLE